MLAKAVCITPTQCMLTFWDIPPTQYDIVLKCYTRP